MFTIKQMFKDGKGYHVAPCHSYTVSREEDGMYVHLFRENDLAAHFCIFVKDVVYVENAAGKTVDTIHATKKVVSAKEAA
jgi:hypothetical protein